MDLGEAKQIVGLELERDLEKVTLKIMQSQYIKRVLEKFGMADSHPVSIPLDPMAQITKQPHVYAKWNGGFKICQISYPFSRNTPFGYMNNPSKAISFILKIDEHNIFAYVHIGAGVYNILYISQKPSQQALGHNDETCI